MKVSTLVFIIVPLLAASTLVEGADSDNTSGAPDATVLTQTHDSKAAGNKHGDATKGGRPTAQSSGATRP
ncbi:hypothetical protein [Pseudomonas putida]